MHYLNQWWNVVNWTQRNKFHLNFNRSSNLFIQENAFQHVVCKMAAILSRPQCFKKTFDLLFLWQTLIYAAWSMSWLYWCPGNAGSQGINSHDIDLVLTEFFFGFSTRGNNPFFQNMLEILGKAYSLMLSKGDQYPKHWLCDGDLIIFPNWEWLHWSVMPHRKGMT